MKEHINNTTIFKGTSRSVQNGILDSMLAICRQQIKEQINEFLAIWCDEIADISNQCQMVIIVTYFHNGNIDERLLNMSFLKVTDKAADGLMQCIQSELDKLISNSPSKLIA